MNGKAVGKIVGSHISKCLEYGMSEIKSGRGTINATTNREDFESMKFSIGGIEFNTYEIIKNNDHDWTIDLNVVLESAVADPTNFARVIQFGLCTTVVIKANGHNYRIESKQFEDFQLDTILIHVVELLDIETNVLPNGLVIHKPIDIGYNK